MQILKQGKIANKIIAFIMAVLLFATSFTLAGFVPAIKANAADSALTDATGHLIGRYFTTTDPTYDAATNTTGALTASGTVTGGVSDGTATFNNAYMTINDTSIFKNVSADTGMTFSFTYNSTLTQAHRHILSIGKNGIGTPNDSFYIGATTTWMSSNKNLFTGYVTSAKTETINSYPNANDYSAGTEYKCKVIVDKSKITYYINGTEYAQTFYQSNNNDNLPTFLDDVKNYTLNYIGISRWTGNEDGPYSGTIKDFCIYNKALTIEQLNAVDNSTQEDINSAMLESAISNYETAMSAGKVYNNMAPAYKAYMTAKEYMDAKTYGGNTSLDFLSAAVALNTAVANMTEYNGASVSTNSTFASPQYFKNVVYASGATTTDVATTGSQLVAGDANGGNCKQQMYIYHPVAVMMYDGTTTPAIPVISNATPTANSGWSANSMTHSIWTDSTDLGVNSAWRGTSATYAFDTIYGVGDYCGYTSDATNSNTTKKTSTYYLANELNFNGTLGSNEFSRTINNLGWNFKISTADTSDYYGSSKQPITTTANEGTNAPVYVINYKVLKDAISAKATPINVSAYDADSTSLYNYLKSIDNATAFNLSSYDYASNTASAVSSCVNDIQSEINSLSALSVPTATDNAYSNLRTAITNATVTNNDDGLYTAESYSTYQSALATAKDAMNAVVDNDYAATYNGKTVATIASDLDTAKANLACAHKTTEVRNAKAATCTEEGYTGDTYCTSLCGELVTAGQSIPKLAHTYVAVHTDTVGDTNGYTQNVCSVCNTVDESSRVYDTTGLDALTAQRQVDSDLRNESKMYNATAFETYTSTVDALLDGFEDNYKTYSQAKIDSIVSAMKTAETTLKANPAQYTVTFSYNLDGVVTEVSKDTYQYGYTAKVSVPENVSDAAVTKWTTVIGSNSPMTLSTFSSSLSYFVSSDANIVVYLAKGENKTETDTATVKVLGRTNSVVDLQYVPYGEYTAVKTNNDVVLTSKTDSEQSYTLNGKNYTFYTLDYFTIGSTQVGNESVDVTIAGNTIVKPTYVAVEGIKVTYTDCYNASNKAATLNQTVNSRWDEKITVTADGTNENTQWLVNDVVVGYGAKYSFRVTSSCTISCKTAQELTPVVTLDYFTYNVYKPNTVTAIGSYQLPEGCQFVSTGAIFKTDRTTTGYTTTNDYEYPALVTPMITEDNLSITNTSGVFEATSFTDTDQYVINIARTANTKFIMGARSYLTYTQNGETKTVYSPVKLIAYNG